jgi:hypothetical protein
MRTTKLCYASVSLGLTVLWLVWGGGDRSARAALGSEGFIVDAATELDESDPFVSPKGRFRIRFPGVPRESDQKVNTTSGPLVIHTTSHSASDGSEYVVAYFDLAAKPDQMPAATTVLEGALSGMVSSGGWKVTSKKAIKIDEYPGLDVTGDVRTPGGAALGRTRIYLVGSRLYQVVLIGPKSKSRSNDFAKALESFELLPGAATAGAAPEAPRTQPAQRPRGATAVAKDLRARRQMARGAGPRPNTVTTKPAPRNAPADETPTVDDPGPDPSKPAEVAIELKSASTRLVDLPREADRRPMRGREPFRETAPKGALLVGVRVGYVGDSHVASIQPIFQVDQQYVEGARQGAPVDGEATVVAKPGYAVGGVNTRTGLLLDAFQLVFMKFKNGRLDTKDSYASAWLGNPRGGNLKNVSGGGKIVAGIHGTTNQREVNSLGLVVAE